TSWRERYVALSTFVGRNPGLVWHFAAGEGMVPVSHTHLALTLGGVVFGAIGYYFIVRGMRIGEVSVVAPFRYSRILFAILIGTMVFGERVDMLALLGIGLIVFAGLYSLKREAQKTVQQKL
ncbi:DMT family transporter, partial [Planktotalea frisia]